MSKLKVADIFAGAGGFGLGFKMANYKLIHSVEMDKWACDTIKANSNHKVSEIDITSLTSKKAIRSFVDSNLDVLIGGPPCQGFSNSGKKDVDDPRNKLYLNYLLWVEALSPSMFVIENVQGITKFKDSDGNLILDNIKDISKDIGYKLSVWKLNALNYGVPQNRLRYFLVGDKRGRKLPIPLPTHLDHPDYFTPLTVNDAISDLPIIRASEGSPIMSYNLGPQNEYQSWARKGSDNVSNHVAMNHTSRIIDRYQSIINGNSLNELNDHLQVRRRNGNGELSKSTYNQNYRHLNGNKSSYTIPAHFYSSFIHPNLPRNITTREAARIQSFPDYYKFQGKRTMVSKKLLASQGKESYLSQYNQVGNAVPPLLAKNIALHLKNYLK